MRLTTLLLFALLLSACANIPAPGGGNFKHIPWNQRQQTLLALHNWGATGVIGGKGPSGGWNAEYDWQQKSQHFDVEVSGPLGVQANQIIGAPGHVTLRDAKNRIFKATSAEQLLLKQTGWRLPISNLVYWVRGLPVPNTPATTKFDVYDHIHTLKQAGWRIVYEQYTTQNKIDLPSVLILYSGQWRVRIVVHEWR